MIAIAEFKASQSGDLDHYELKRIPLYYFRDVQRLVHLLNPNIATKSFITDSNTASPIQPGQLDQAQSNVIEAMAALSSAQAALRDNLTEETVKAEELKSLEAQLAPKEAAVRNGELRKIEIDHEGIDIDAQIAKVDDALTATPDDKRLMAQKSVLEKQKRDWSERQAIEAKTQEYRIQDRDKIAGKRDAAKTDLGNAKGLEAGLKVDYKAKAEAVAAARTSNSQRAIQSTQDFAFLRDNAPFFRIVGDSTSSDPILRCSLYGFRDRSDIAVRGRPEDIRAVESAIQEFDVPTAQTELWLWTLELNLVSDGSQATDNALSKALHESENKIQSITDQTAKVSADFRNAIAETLQEVEKQYDGDLNVLASTLEPSQQGYIKADIGVLYFFSNDLTRYLGFEQNPKDETKDLGARYDAAQSARRNLPDPRRTSSLGQSLMILFMAKHDVRERILTKLKGLTPNGETRFSRLRSALGISNADRSSLNRGSMKSDTTPLDAVQTEILEWVARGAIQRSYRELFDRALNTVKDSTKANLDGLNVAYQSYNDLLNRLLRVNAPEIHAPDDPTNPEKIKVFAQSLTSVLPSSRPLIGREATESAANILFREIFQGIANDVRVSIIEKELEDLRSKMATSRINVGALQRLSVIATDRIIARVETGAIAQVGLGETQNLIEEGKQALAIIAAFQGGASGTKVFTGLKVDAEPPKQALYAIGTGGTFLVTPYIDKSGQSVSFTFDHSSRTIVRDPDNTINPLLPRIENHSTNTEVVLSNLELKRVSKFESNVKLGLPEKRWGGLPIIRDIPILKELPILGWFARRQGQGATRQTSIVYGQSFIYPTIRDLIDVSLPSGIGSK